MIFNRNRQMLVSGIERGTLWNCPRAQDPLHLEPEIIVQASRGMFLNDEDSARLRATQGDRAAEWLGGTICTPFTAVFA